MTITRITVLNPFEPFRQRVIEVIPWQEGVTLRDVVEVPEGVEVVASLNGRVVSEGWQKCLLRPGDCVVTCPVLGGGDNTKAILRMVAMIVVSVVAWYAAPVIAGTGAWGVWEGASLLTFAAAAAIQIVGGLLVNAVLPPPRPELGMQMDTEGYSPAYGWDGPKTTVGQGMVIPILYGTCRTGGHVISVYTEPEDETDLDDPDQMLRVLIALSEGEIGGLVEPVSETILINGNPAGNYRLDGASGDIRLGTNDQEPMTGWDKQVLETPVGVKITTDYFTKQTEWDDVEELEVEVVLPNGLYEIASDGSLQNNTVNLTIEFQKVGETDWHPFPIVSEVVENQRTDFVQIGSFEGLPERSPYTGVSAEDGFSLIVSKGYISRIVFDFVGQFYGNGTVAKELWHVYGRRWYGDPNSISPPAWEGPAVLEISPSSPPPVHFDLYQSDPAIQRIDLIFVLVEMYDSQGNLLPYGQGYQYMHYSPWENLTWWQRVEDASIVGDSQRRIRRIYRTSVTAGQYNIRVKRREREDPDPKKQSACYWTVLREKKNVSLAYPNLAYVGLRLKASDQLSGGLPQFSFLVQGRKIKVYTDENNYTYEVSSNPAWIVYDLLTNTRYGGGIPESQIDLVRFLEWAEFCDELVPDGRGGYEKRCEFNGVIDREMRLWEAVQMVAQVGRAVVAMSGTKYTVIIDKRDQPVQLFTVGNILQDSFEVSYLSMDDRANEIEVRFQNRDRDYQGDVVLVSDPSSDLPQRRVTLQLPGVTKTTQAYREAMYRLNLNRAIIRTIKFDADIDAIACTVGDVILVQHDVPQWGYGGRVVSATANTVTLDREIEIEAGQQYAILIRHSDDDSLEEVRLAYHAPGKYSTLTLASAWQKVPQQNDLYTVGKIETFKAPYRVTAIKKSSDLTMTIEAVEYRDEVYDSDLNPIYPITHTHLDPKPRIYAVYISEEMVRTGSAVLNKVNVSWDTDDNYTRARVKIYEGWRLMIDEEVQGKCYFFYGETYQQYRIVIIPFNSVGMRGDEVTRYFTPTLQGLPPSDVTGLSASLQQRTVILTWAPCPDIDFHHYLVLHGDLQEPINTYTTTATTISIPLSSEGQHQFHVYAVDFMGNLSKNPATVTVDVEGLLIENIILEQAVDMSRGTFSGTVCFTSSQEIRRPAITGSPISLPIEGPQDCDTQNYIAGLEGIRVSDLDVPVNWFSLMDFMQSGVWESEVIDLGSVVTGYLSIRYQTSYQIHATVREFVCSVEALEGIRVSDLDPDSPNGDIQVRALCSIDGQNWTELSGGLIQAQYLKFKISINTKKPIVEHIVRNLSFVLDVPDVVDSGVATISGSGRITYNRQFHQVTSVTALAVGGGQVNVLGFDNTGFDVEIVGGGTRDISWIAHGY